MSTKKIKKAHAQNKLRTIQSLEFQAKKEAILQDMKNFFEKEFNRKKAMLAEIRSYAEGKQIILNISK